MVDEPFLRSVFNHPLFWCATLGAPAFSRTASTDGLDGRWVPFADLGANLLPT